MCIPQIHILLHIIHIIIYISVVYTVEYLWYITRSLRSYLIGSFHNFYKQLITLIKSFYNFTSNFIISFGIN